MKSPNLCDDLGVDEGVTAVYVTAVFVPEAYSVLVTGDRKCKWLDGVEICIDPDTDRRATGDGAVGVGAGCAESSYWTKG